MLLFEEMETFLDGGFSFFNAVVSAVVVGVAEEEEVATPGAETDRFLFETFPGAFVLVDATEERDRFDFALLELDMTAFVEEENFAVDLRRLNLAEDVALINDLGIIEGNPSRLDDLLKTD